MIRFSSINNVSALGNTISVEIKHDSPHPRLQDNTEATLLTGAFLGIGYDSSNVFYKDGDDRIEIILFDPQEETTPIDVDSIKKQLNITAGKQYTGLA